MKLLARRGSWSCDELPIRRTTTTTPLSRNADVTSDNNNRKPLPRRASFASLTMAKLPSSSETIASTAMTFSQDLSSSLSSVGSNTSVSFAVPCTAELMNPQVTYFERRRVQFSQERNQVYEDVHGVSDCVEETPELVARSLAALPHSASTPRFSPLRKLRPTSAP